MAFRRSDIRRYGRIVKRAAPYVPAALQVARDLKFRRGSAPTMTMTKKKRVDTGFTSRQHDVRQQYVKRSMPRGKRKRWVSFVRKVNAVSDNDRGVTTIVFNKRGQVLGPTVNLGFRRQAVVETHLYGYAGTDVYSSTNAGVYGAADVLYIFENDPLLGLGAIATTRKIRLHSAVMDVTIRNQTDAIMELDCYEVIYYRTAPGSMSSLVDTMQTAQASAETVSTGAFRTTITDMSLRGATPFEMGPGISAAKCKILKKTKYFVDPGTLITRQFRDPKNRFIDDSYIQRRNGLVLPGFTKSLIWIAKRQSWQAENDGTGMEIGCTTTYKYTVEGQARDRTLYVTN